MIFSELNKVESELKSLIDKLINLQQRHLALVDEIPAWSEAYTKRIKEKDRLRLAAVRTTYVARRVTLQQEIEKHNPGNHGSGIDWRRRSNEREKLISGVRAGSFESLNDLGYSLPQEIEHLTRAYIKSVKAIRDDLKELEATYKRNLENSTRERDLRKAQLRQQRDTALADLDESYSERIQALDSDFDRERKKLEQLLEASSKNAADTLRTIRNDEDRRLEQVLAKLDGEEQSASKGVNSDNALILNAITRHRQELVDRLSSLRNAPPTLPIYQRPWIDAEWQPFSTPLVPPKHGEMRLGRRHFDTPVGKFELPVLVPFLGESHLWIQFNETERADAIAYVQSLLLRLYSATVPGRLSVLLYDPKGGGFDFRVFTTLLPQELRLFDVVNRSGELEKALDKLSREAIITNQRVPTDYDSAFEMNAVLETDVHPHKIVVIKDFPVGLDKRVFERLDEIGQSGHKSGLHIIGLMSNLEGPEQEPLLPDPTKHGTCIVFKRDRPYFCATNRTGAAKKDTTRRQVSDFRQTSGAREGEKKAVDSFSLDIGYNKNFPQLLLEEICGELKSPRNISRRFLDNMPEEYDMGSEKSAAHLRTPIGFSDRTTPVHLQFDDKTLVHAFVLGKTGMGKSTLVTQVIAGLTTRYSPDELELVLLDDKGGVEFSRWQKLPHVTLLEIGRDTPFALAILEHLSRVMTERNELFRSHGQRNISMFKKNLPDRHMPRIVMIWDNAYEAFKDDQGLSDKVLDTLNRLAVDGRSVGIHMLLVTNHLHGIGHGLRGIRSQFAIRINFLNDDSIFETSFDDRSTIPKDRGEAQCVGLKQDEPQKVQLINVFALDDSEQTDLELVLDRAMQKYPSPNPKVLVAGVRANLETHRDFILKRLSVEVTDEIIMWLGEPVSIRDPVHFSLDRRFANNVLFTGDERLLSPLLALQVEYLATQSKSTNTILHIFHDDNVLPETQTVLNRCPAFAWERYEEFITAFTDCVKENNTALRHIFLVWNLETLMSIRARDENDDDREEMWRDFASNLQSAPQSGIHLVAWSPVPSGIRSLFSPNDLFEVFNYRIASALDRDNMSAVATGNWFEPIGDNRAVLFQRDESPLLFAPYSTSCSLQVPTDEPSEILQT